MTAKMQVSQLLRPKELREYCRRNSVSPSSYLRGPSRDGHCNSSELDRRISNVFPSTKLLMQPGAVVAEIENIRSRIDKIEEERDHKLYLEIARVFDLAKFLSNNEPAWIEYCRAQRWGNVDARLRPKPDEPQDALRIVISDLCSTIESRSRRKNRTHVYLSTLRELDARSVEPAQAFEAIRDTPGGLSGLSRSYAKRLSEIRAKAGAVEGRPVTKPTSTGKMARKKPDLRTRKTDSKTDKRALGKAQGERFVAVHVRNNKAFRAIMSAEGSAPSIVELKILAKYIPNRLLIRMES